MVSSPSTLPNRGPGGDGPPVYETTSVCLESEEPYPDGVMTGKDSPPPVLVTSRVFGSDSESTGPKTQTERFLQRVKTSPYWSGVRVGKGSLGKGPTRGVRSLRLRLLRLTVGGGPCRVVPPPPHLFLTDLRSPRGSRNPERDYPAVGLLVVRRESVALTRSSTVWFGP